jgi:predicted anti-sigma-YlaC factor YlaD
LNDRPGLLKCLNATCRDAARMVSEQEARPLSRPERLGLSLHLLICRSCRRYRRTALLLRSLLRHAASTGALNPPDKLPPQARDRIREKMIES